MKYIIKNCPAVYVNHNHEYDCDKADYFCQGCTDCVMKRIVDECRNELEKRNAYSVSIHHDFARGILKFVEIEEVDEM